MNDFAPPRKLKLSGPIDWSQPKEEEDAVQK